MENDEMKKPKCPECGYMICGHEPEPIKLNNYSALSQMAAAQAAVFSQQSNLYPAMQTRPRSVFDIFRAEFW
jgi:hypothetical protein